MTFLDDATSHHAAIQLKRKSDAFEAFKTYKAFAENHFETKMKELQDDKEGEYLSNAFIKFTDECRIHRRHTTRNRPQQNVLQREQIALWQIISQPCSLRQNYHLHIGETL